MILTTIILVLILLFIVLGPTKFVADIYERVSDYEDEELKGYEGSYEDGHENVAKTDVSVEGFEPI